MFSTSSPYFFSSPLWNYLLNTSSAFVMRVYLWNLITSLIDFIISTMKANGRPSLSDICSRSSAAMFYSLAKVEVSASLKVKLRSIFCFLFCSITSSRLESLYLSFYVLSFSFERITSIILEILIWGFYFLFSD